jgi:hypothetical protein
MFLNKTHSCNSKQQKNTITDYAKYWISNLSDTKGGTYAEGVWEQGAEEDI